MSDPGEFARYLFYLKHVEPKIRAKALAEIHKTAKGCKERRAQPREIGLVQAFHDLPA